MATIAAVKETMSTSNSMRDSMKRKIDSFGRISE
ncbi:hypothetical protein [Rhizobium phage vB_RleA_TRX32-1]|uniref:Uncharacterized protein n=1 Tax=Rhizobium phage vB_RleA_TRX32-1 TaxID=2777321 RepID=A0A7T7K8A8_9CAUD|nr:hypothetical protein [Rhizobium phage vB_RleA_TRX32-1]